MTKHHANSATFANASDHKKKTAQSRPAVLVEFPAEGDIVAGPYYTFQISTVPGSNGVEVSIDKGDWKPCREALGLWWHDWSGYEKGAHELTARTRTGDGIAISSGPRRFLVE